MRSPASSSRGAGDGQLAAAALLVAPHRRGRTLARYSAGAGRACSRRFLLLLGRHRDLAGGGERRDFGGGGLAGALGDLAARILLPCGAPLRSRSASSPPLSRGGVLLLPRPCGAPLPRRDGEPPRRLARLPRAADRHRRARLAARLLVGLARILQDAHSGGVFLGRQRARHAGGRRAGSTVPGAAGSGAAGAARATVGAAVSAARSLDRRGARRDDALLADLDRHLLRAPMREALAHLPGLDRPGPQSQRAAGTQASAAASALARVSLLLVRISHSLRYHHPADAGLPGAKSVSTAARRPKAGKPPHIAHQPLAAAHPPPTATCTTRSRPNAAPSSAARQNHRRSGSPRPSAPSLRRPLSPPSSAKSSSAALPVPDRLADPVEPGDRRARPTREPEFVDAAPRQQRFDPRSARSARHRNRPPRRAREKPLRHRPLDYIAPRRSTTNPARAAVPRYPARSHRPERRQSAAARRGRRISPVTMQRRCGASDAAERRAAGRPSSVSSR